jgi:ADP-heptose:LPS heptosyltransferase
LAKTSQDSQPALLVTELWGLGDLALAVPFLRAAAAAGPVCLVAKPHAEPILARFAPTVELVPLVAPWTAFRGKYRLHRWPWGELGAVLRTLRQRGFGTGASARPDPRDHALLRMAGAARTFGFPRAGSGILISDPLARPCNPHRAEHWAALAAALGLVIAPAQPPRREGRRIIIHAGAGRPTRLWPRARFEQVARALEKAGWQTEILDDSFTGVGPLLDKLDSADRFVGSDSGPGHLAALLGVPTFTIFGPQLPQLFSPRHPRAAWIEGAPCPYKPCFDNCRFSEPRCLLAVETDAVLERLLPWLEA